MPLALFARVLRHRAGGTLGVTFFELGVNFLAQTLVVGLVTQLVYGHLQGRRATALDSLAVASRRAPALLGLAFLVQFGTTLGTVCCLLPGLAVAWLTAVAPAALVLEGLGPIAALLRSARLMRDALPRWLGVVVLQFLLVLPLTLSAGLVEQYSVELEGAAGPGLVLAETLARVVFYSLATCLTSVVLTVLYIDGRVRAEGFDLVMRFERLSAARGGAA